jgi:hypothetical protein
VLTLLRQFVCASVAALCLLSGCGGAKTARVSGKITFKGQPVPAGKIYFLPDTAKGGTGQPGFADIKDGQYDTAAPGGQAGVIGPVLVSITGVDPHKKPEKSPNAEVTATLLFEKYETTADLAGGDVKLDFDVPESAAGPKPAPKQPTPAGP